MSALRNRAGVRLAQGVGTAWAVGSVPDRFISRALRRLTRILGGKVAPGERAQLLLRLAPAIRRVGARPGLAADLSAVLRALRAAVHSRVAAITDDPHLWALGAAALALTAPPTTATTKPKSGVEKDRLSRARELVRRVRRRQIRVGSYTWIATRQNGYATSALLALAELAIGERERALALLGTLGRLNVEGQQIGTWPQTLARVASVLLSRGKPAKAVRLVVDGKARTVVLAGGIARVPVRELSRPGRHEIQVSIAQDSRRAGGVLAHVQAVAEYGVPWSMVPPRPGSIAVAIEGKSKGRDERAELELVVTNRSPRAIAAPTLEVNLPAGAELDAQGRAAMRRRLAAEPDATRGTLRLLLGGLPPGGTRRIPLPLRWSVAGELRGLGVAAYPGDRPEDLSVKPPRVWTISAPGVK